MVRKSHLRKAIGGLLDAIATRTGMSMSLAVLLTVSALAGLYVERSVGKTEESLQVFNDRLIRNGFMSMNDIQRLLLVAMQAREQGQVTDKLMQDFISATDFLYVRVDHFRRSLRGLEQLESARTAITAVEKVLALAESASTAPIDVDRLWSDLAAASGDARRALSAFLDVAGRIQNEVLHAQSNAMKEQRNVVLASLVGLTLVGIAALALLRKEVLASRARDLAESHIQFLAYFDQLTKLPNRVRFQSHLADLLKRDRPVTLILIDVDYFKTVNDTYGHATGDIILCEVARLLSEVADGAGGMAVRLGGDEFAVVLPDESQARVTDLLDTLLAKGRAGFVTQGETIQIGLSIGYAASSTIGKDAVRSVDTLFRVADFALYSSKSAGRGRYTNYDRTLERRYLERRAVVEELTQATASEELEIFLQPKVNLPDGDVYGFEGLVRWRRNGCIVPPEDFINVAEESGLIYDIDTQMLRRATTVLGAFNKRHGTDYSVSVNLSALHFNSTRIIDLLRDALEQSELAKGLLVLEITETVELRDWWQAQKIIGELRDLGARISIDDFGTGYSSLAYLRSKVVDEVKIDRSIVEQIETSVEAQFLLDGILEISRNLNLDVVVEGVERSEQLRQLCAMGATRGQGFLFGQPLPAELALREAMEARSRIA